MANCQHTVTAFYRHLAGGSIGYHIAEHCTACGANVNGNGFWVGRDIVRAVGLDPDKLPVWPRDETPSLFS